MLKSERGTDRPQPGPFEYVSGARHPTAADLERYLQPFDGGALELPATIPLLHSPGSPGIQRGPLYGVSLVWQSRERSTHAVIFGKSGSGKNTRFIDLTRCSAISDPTQTVISVSLKSSDFGPIKAACVRAQKRCLVVNFADDWRSVGFNPLRSARENEAPDIIRRLAEASRNPRSSESEFWTQMFRTGLQALYEGGYQSFPEMFRFYSQPRKELVKGLEKLGNSHANKIASFLAGGSWNAETTEATIVGSFVPFQQESVQRVMSVDELRLDKLFSQPVCLHVEVDEATLETTLPLIQMLLRAIIDKLIATAQKLGQRAVPATIFIDDLPSLGQVFSVERLLTLRSRKVGIVAGCQSIAALYHAFPNSGPAILEAFANQVVLPGCSPEDAEYFSRASGQQMVRVPAGNGHAAQYLTLPLLSPTDIRTPEYRHFLLGRPLTFLLGDAVFQAYVQHSFEVPAWREMLHASRSVTGTEPLRQRRLPNRFRVPGRRAQRRKALREQRVQLTFPFHFEDDELNDWSAVELRRGIRKGLEQLGIKSTFGWVRTWWREHLKRNRSHLPALLRLTSRLIEMKATAEDYYQAAQAYPDYDPELLLAKINLRLKYEAWSARRRKSRDRKAEVGQPGESGRLAAQPHSDGKIKPEQRAGGQMPPDNPTDPTEPNVPF